VSLEEGSDIARSLRKKPLAGPMSQAWRICWHFFWQVKQDILEPLVYSLILATLLGYRLWPRRHDLATALGA
jgi:hypothetical protein